MSGKPNHECYIAMSQDSYQVLYILYKRSSSVFNVLVCFTIEEILTNTSLKFTIDLENFEVLHTSYLLLLQQI